MSSGLSCRKCGGSIVGDGVTMALHCENVECAADREADAPVLLCDEARSQRGDGVNSRGKDVRGTPTPSEVSGYRGGLRLRLEHGRCGCLLPAGCHLQRRREAQKNRTIPPRGRPVPVSGNSSESVAGPSLRVLFVAAAVALCCLLGDSRGEYTATFDYDANLNIEYEVLPDVMSKAVATGVVDALVAPVPNITVTTGPESESVTLMPDLAIESALLENAGERSRSVEDAALGVLDSMGTVLQRIPAVLLGNWSPSGASWGFWVDPGVLRKEEATYISVPESARPIVLIVRAILAGIIGLAALSRVAQNLGGAASGDAEDAL
jgi:hypothetical protein